MTANREVQDENSPIAGSRLEPLNHAERRPPDRLVADQDWNRADQVIGAPVHGEVLVTCQPRSVEPVLE